MILCLQARAGCVDRLLGLMTCGHMDVTIAVTGALASIVGCAAGTVALLESEEAVLLAELLDWSDPQLERNVLAIVANAAVNPAMRQQFVVRHQNTNKKMISAECMWVQDCPTYSQSMS